MDNKNINFDNFKEIAAKQPLSFGYMLRGYLYRCRTNLDYLASTLLFFVMAIGTPIYYHLGMLTWPREGWNWVAGYIVISALVSLLTFMLIMLVGALILAIINFLTSQDWVDKLKEFCRSLNTEGYSQKYKSMMLLSGRERKRNE